jgi:hypothetical protein
MLSLYFSFQALDLQPFSGQGFAGLLEAGKAYTVRYAAPKPCNDPERPGYFEQSFTAVGGVNRLELDPRREVRGCE